MAEKILSVVGTVKSRLPDISIKDGQLIFVQDNPCIALDLNGKRNFFNQIVEIPTDIQRQELLAPINGCFYFVIETAVLWSYQSAWIQITTSPEEVVFIGTEFPQLGTSHTLYVNQEEGNISVWDASLSSYKVVANHTQAISKDTIIALFK